MLSNLKRVDHKPVAWLDINLDLPEVVELFGEDGERQWALAQNVSAFKVTEPSEFCDIPF